MNERSAMGFKDLLLADLVRIHGNASVGKLLRSYLTHRTFRPIVSMRLCKAAANSSGAFSLFAPVFRALHKWNCSSAGMDLSWQAGFGPGLAITHGWGLVVSPGATIGRNCTLFHGATIGQGDRINSNGARETGFPILEDEVWVGPHALIVGDVRIGRGARILGGSFVTKSVPPNTMVGGNPAQFLKHDICPDVANPV